MIDSILVSLILPDSNINDGYGLFYSTFSTTFFLNVERAD